MNYLFKKYKTGGIVSRAHEEIRSFRQRLLTPWNSCQSCWTNFKLRRRIQQTEATSFLFWENRSHDQQLCASLVGRQPWDNPERPGPPGPVAIVITRCSMSIRHWKRRTMYGGCLNNQRGAERQQYTVRNYVSTRYRYPVLVEQELPFVTRLIGASSESSLVGAFG